MPRRAASGSCSALCVDHIYTPRWQGSPAASGASEVEIGVAVEGQEVLGRYEHAMPVSNGRLYVSGGHHNAMPDASTYYTRQRQLIPVA